MQVFGKYSLRSFRMRGLSGLGGFLVRPVMALHVGVQAPAISV